MEVKLIYDCYLGVSAITILFIIFIYMNIRKEKNQTGRDLQKLYLSSITVMSNYMLSVISKSRWCTSLFSSCYFISIDCMLIFFLNFTVNYTKMKEYKTLHVLKKILAIYIGIDSIVMLINPFKEIAISYQLWSEELALYQYQMHPLYYMHLIYTYFMITLVVILFSIKIMQVPTEYRKANLYILTGILTVIAINAIFLFRQNDSIYVVLDYSIWGYFLIIMLLNWVCIDYPVNGLLNHFRTRIFESFDEGLLLFNYDGELLMKNDKADQILSIEKENTVTLENTLYHLNVKLTKDQMEHGFRKQVFVHRREKETRKIQIVYAPLTNKQNECSGYFLTLSDLEYDMDPLTGFLNWQSYITDIQEYERGYQYPMVVAMVDISRLSIINQLYGRNFGDQLVAKLARSMKNCFPEGTFFLRGQEANLIAISSEKTERDTEQYLQRLTRDYEQEILYAVSVMEEGSNNFLTAIRNTEKSIRNKKLLNENSTHSNLVNSLNQALQECDHDTEEHVKRTQILGANLGKRIGLTDVQQSDLSLLCILHDIGKSVFHWRFSTSPVS